MAIILNDNIDTRAPKPSDSRFGPYTTTAAALSGIPAYQRYVGLTVGVGTPIVEYWFDSTLALVLKTSSGTVTGITAGTGINIGGTAIAPIISVTSPTQLTTNISTDVIADGASDVKYPSAKATKTYVDANVAGLLDDRGNFPATSGDYPIAGGSGPAGAIRKGDLWFISVPGNLNGIAVGIGASVRALVDDAQPTTNTDWDILDTGLGFIPENVANKVIRGTSIAAAPTSETQYASLSALTEYLASIPPSTPTLEQVLAATTPDQTSVGYDINLESLDGNLTTNVGRGEFNVTNVSAGTSVTAIDDTIAIASVNDEVVIASDMIEFTNDTLGTLTLNAVQNNNTVTLPNQTATLIASVNSSIFADASTGDITIPLIGSTGTENYVSKWNADGISLTDSVIYDNGTNVGIGTNTPATGLHLKNKFLTIEGDQNFIAGMKIINPVNGANHQIKLNNSDLAFYTVTQSLNDLRRTIQIANGFSTVNTVPFLNLRESAGQIPTWIINPNEAGTLPYAGLLNLRVANAPGGYIQSYNLASYDAADTLVSYVKPNGDGYYLGNVGIGTTTPTAKLDINGTFHTTGGNTLDNLAGTGNRMVIASALGLLGTAPIPIGTVTSVGLDLGTTGTDINIEPGTSPVTNSGTILLNIPNASATARGVMNTTTQTIAGAKTFSSDLTVGGGATVGTRGNPNNVIFGFNAAINSGGTYNAILGAGAGQGLTSGNQNTAVGGLSMFSFPDVGTGQNNTAVGFYSGRYLGGSHNVGVGHQVFPWGSNLFPLTVSGTYNTALGASSGGGIGTGSNNTIIGARVSLPSQLSNNVLIGDGAGNVRFRDDNTNTILPRLAGLGTRMVTAGTNGELSTQTIPSGGSGTVTSIATSGPITGGSPAITNAGTIGITQAGASQDGYLSQSNWNTFNNKFDLPSLTTGSVLFSNGTTIAQDNANFFWDNANDRLGIGIATPGYKLDVNGIVNATAINLQNNVQTGIYGGSNLMEFWAGNNKLSTYRLNGNILGSYFEHTAGFTNSGTIASGSQNVWRLAGSVTATTAANGIDVTQLLIDPGYAQSTFGKGILRGVYYNPSGSIGTSKHIAFENTEGNVFLNSTSGQTAIGTAAPNVTAKLQIDSTTQGFLPPRMTQTERLAIGSPAEGLIVYDTTNSALGVYSGGGWRKLSMEAF